MKLPNAELVRVDREKVAEYLLAVDHPDGSSKARFFIGLGYRIERWEILVDALRTHGREHAIVNVVESEFGTRYTVEGELGTPDGRNPRVRTVWMVEKGSDIPRLITAYPC